MVIFNLCDGATDAATGENVEAAVMKAEDRNEGRRLKGPEGSRRIEVVRVGFVWQRGW